MCIRDRSCAPGPLAPASRNGLAQRSRSRLGVGSAPSDYRVHGDPAILSALMSEKIVFQLEDLRKYYGQKEILKGLTLSFLAGAKIGVIGPNGAGKSTLLRIMSGQDKAFEGTAKPAAGLTVGYLEQEPPLTEDLDVAGNLEEAVAHLRQMETRYNEVLGLLGSVSGAEEEKLNNEYERLNDEMTTKGCLLYTSPSPRDATLSRMPSSA